VEEYDPDAFVFPDGSSIWMASNSGYPAVSVPAGIEDSTRHPFGISFLGNAAYTEVKLLGNAFAFVFE
jgi:amidase